MNNSSQTRADLGTIGLAARERAHTVLHEVLDRGRPLDEVLATDKRFSRLNDRDRAFARNLVATTLRRLGQIDALIADCLDKPLPPSAAAARNALRIGICQILFLDTQTHAAVDTAVTLAAKRGPEQFKGLVNAILRRIVRAGEAEILEAGLIVIGTHGHGAVYDVLIGSYSAGIIRKSKLPVLVVPVRNI